MKHTNPTRWQREMIVMGWRLVPATGLIFTTDKGTWIVTDVHGNAPESATTKVDAQCSKEERVIEVRHGRAAAICKRINPSFRVHVQHPAKARMQVRSA